MFKKSLYLCTAAVIGLSVPLGAQEKIPEGEPREEITAPEKSHEDRNKDATIVVSATKTEIDERETGASITVISEKEMRDRVNNTLADVIRSVPGVSVSSQSRFGGITSTFIRGAKSENTVVLVDGVRINDPTSPSRGANIGMLLTDNVERIEIIRGSQGTLYGSDAMGGVMNIITKKGSGDPSVTFAFEGGAYYTFKEMIGVNGGTDRAFYSFAVSKQNSQGYNATSRTPVNLGPVDRDGYEDMNFSTRLGLRTAHDGLLTFSAWYSSGRVDVDDYGMWGGMSVHADDPNYKNETDQFASNIDYSIPLFKWWESRLTLSYMNLVRRIRDHADLYNPTENDESWYRGTIMKGEWRNRFTIASVDEVVVGVDYEQERASSHSYYFGSASAFEQKQSVAAAYIQNHLKLFDRVFFISGIRYTSPDHYSAALCYSLSGSVIVPYTETRLKGNFSTGFRTPSLYQIDTQLQNRALGTAVPSLSPEESMSFDVGFVQPILGEILSVEMDYFWIRYTDPITFYSSGWVPPYGYYYNGIRGASSKGFEFIVTVRPLEELTIAGSYTYTDSRDNTTNREFFFRPRHQGSLWANYLLLGRVNINALLLYVGERLDTSNRYINAHYRLDAAVTVRVIDQIHVFVRGENLLNEDYEEQLGYQTPGISFYGGFRGTL
ncbi:MAG: TonB-dependent receptor [Spirochaetes bacterium]|nr:TonB-dependent receptor [Spirochaetota bacterium]